MDKTMTSLNRREFIYRTALGVTASTVIGAQAIAGQKRRKPNIVFVLVDQYRAAATGYAGDPNVKTPYLDAMAAESINFENAVTVCPVCTPFRAALLTGRYPTSTGMFMNDLYLPAVPENQP